MPTVSEQLQKYRAMKVQGSPVSTQRRQAAILSHHPSTKDYFQGLMQRWQREYMQNKLQFCPIDSE